MLASAAIVSEKLRTDATQVVSGERYRQVGMRAVDAELEVSKILLAAF